MAAKINCEFFASGTGSLITTSSSCSSLSGFSLGERRSNMLPLRAGIGRNYVPSFTIGTLNHGANLSRYWLWLSPRCEKRLSTYTSISKFLAFCPWDLNLETPVIFFEKPLYAIFAGFCKNVFTISFQEHLAVLRSFVKHVNCLLLQVRHATLRLSDLPLKAAQPCLRSSLALHQLC